MGDIYLLTCPNEKKYVGQCLKIYSNGKKNGYENRWKQHIYEAINNKKTSVLLNNAIRLYNPNNWKVELICECPIKELDEKEQEYIKLYNTLSPNGYNLTSGGKKYSYQSDETKKKKSESLKGKNLGRILNKRKRLDPDDNTLPKYLRKIKDGYRISNHSSGIDIAFKSKKLSMDEKLNIALKKLDELNNARY